MFVIEWGFVLFLIFVLFAILSSFSDGGKYDNSIDSAVNQALTMLKEGAQIIDIGGESTRPKAETIEIEIEKNRIIPVIE